MDTRTYQLIGRRLDRPQALLFRDQDGKHFLRPGCGARLVRITSRDASRLMRHYTYHRVIDGEWRDEHEVAALECAVPLTIPAEVGAE